MNLSFLNPWLWLGVLALAAPVWLHLRRKPPANLLRFSALRFLDDQPVPRQSPLQLRERLLFLLRAAALLLIVAAFTWPFLRDEAALLIRESRVYLLDNTLSHQSGEGFVRDRDRIAREIAGAGREVQVAVIELTSQPRVIASFGDDREVVVRKLRELKPSFQRGSLLTAFQQANSLLMNSLGDRKRIVLCSDNQENQWTENASVPPFLHNVEVTLPAIAATQAPNLSLAEPRAQRIFLGDKSVVNFAVQLNHQGPAKTANVTLRANGQTIVSRAVELPPAAGSVPLQAQWEADPALWLRGEVSVEGDPDALPGDNRVFFSLPPVREGKVALLARSPYLRLALSPEVMRGQWAARSLDPARVAAELAAGRDADVLCIESNYLQSADARKLVQRYISNGRGVLLLVDRITPLVGGALRELGFEPEPPAPSGAKAAAERIEFVFPNHPIFHPFVASDFGNLAEVKILRHVRLRCPSAMPLMFSQSGDAVFFQTTKGPGRLFVAAFGFEREQTDWPLHPTFIPFLDLCLQSARAEDDMPSSFEPGEMCALHVAADPPVREVALRDERGEVVRTPVVGRRAQFRVPDLPGLYALCYDSGHEPEKMLSVNPSPKESQLVYVESPDALKNWQFRGAQPASPATRTVPARGLSLSGIWQQRLWWWMLVAGLMALMAEQVWLVLRKERA